MSNPRDDTFKKYSTAVLARYAREITLFRVLRRLALALIVVAPTACMTPALSPEKVTRDYGFHQTLLPGNPFQHVAYFNHLANEDTRLHIYLDNDGKPWLSHFLPAPDPTPTHSLVLDLMRKDPAPALYLGRPCYHGMARHPPCAVTWWTDARYSETVVASLAHAIEYWRRAHPASHITLVGHSGGGTLAVLLAKRVPDVDAVITLAGNLDVAAWTHHHGYSPLHTSIDPASQAVNPGILQWHYQGELDRVIPAGITDRYFQHNPQANRISMADYGHHCCWATVWPEILVRLNATEF